MRSRTRHDAFPSRRCSKSQYAAGQNSWGRALNPAGPKSLPTEGRFPHSHWRPSRLFGCLLTLALKVPKLFATIRCARAISVRYYLREGCRSSVPCFAFFCAQLRTHLRAASRPFPVCDGGLLLPSANPKRAILAKPAKIHIRAILITRFGGK